jgi:DNA-binding transcriptional MocR family regulator
MAVLDKKGVGDLPLYENVAGHVIRLIEGGTFRVGERVPSVRKLGKQLDVSVTTVLGAYRILEDRGYIEPRPQSGYFVRSRAANLPASIEPTMTKAARRPTPVNVSELTMMILEDAVNPDLVQLGAAIPDIKLLPIAKLQRAMARIGRNSGDRAGNYAASAGCQELRVQIARRELETGVSLTPEEIIVTSGAQEAITLCLKAVCEPGDTVALESPCYYGFLQAIEAMRVRALEIPAHPREGMSLEALELALREHDVKAVLAIPNFNNPLGSCIPARRKKELVEMLAKREIPLIEDDIYGDLAFGVSGAERPTVCKAYDKKGLVMMCDSFSKTLSPGLRVGWVAPGRFYKKVLYQKIVSTIATATLPQLTVAEFLANGGYEHHLRRLRRIQQRQMRAMIDAVLRYFPPGTRTTRPEGGHVVWVEMPEGVDSLKLYEKAVEKGVTIAPGPLFSTKGQYLNYVRLNAAHWDFSAGRAENAVKTLGYLAAGMIQ